VVDVVPADPDDPRGVALSASVLPLVLAGVLSGLAVWRAGRPGLAQAGALVGASLLAGRAAIGIAQGWLSLIGGDWLVNAGVLALTVLAIGSAVAGLAARLGHAGLALAVVVMVLLGNPLSGVSSAPELLPAPHRRHRSATPSRRRWQPAAEHRLLRRRRGDPPPDRPRPLVRPRPGRPDGRCRARSANHNRGGADSRPPDRPLKRMIPDRPRARRRWPSGLP
jgi:hypothetical protein